MKILTLIRLRPGVTAADLTPHLHREARRVWDLYQQGILREVYHTPGTSARAVLVLEVDDEAAASAALDALPLAAAGLISFELFPLVPYPGWGRLFTAEN